MENSHKYTNGSGYNDSNGNKKFKKEVITWRDNKRKKLKILNFWQKSGKIPVCTKVEYTQSLINQMLRRKMILSGNETIIEMDARQWLFHNFKKGPSLEENILTITNKMNIKWNRFNEGMTIYEVNPR